MNAGWLCAAIRFALASPSLAELARALSQLSPAVLTDEQRGAARSMIERDLGRRREAANAKNRAEWAAIHNREQWEEYRGLRLARLRESLGSWPGSRGKLKARVTRLVHGDGFVIENVVYESRPGDWVPGNLYRPARPGRSMPGILIAHAHHRGKEQGELQDMGMTWARAGCLVLVIDQVGYGERRAHPFHGPDDYPKPYRHGRQDYYYRYDSGLQLHLIGESLMGWMVWDLQRGIDLLLARQGIDPNKIIMLGAVAGGGDPCGITAALDERVAAAVPFNFGGPQPETPYPLPEDADASFNYLMGSYWESTRGLRRTAADGFFHWTITASIAPRRLIHAHEFSWDRERDPVWKRYRRIYEDFYRVPDRLAAAHGKGLLQGEPPEASHCGQIGRFHRRMIHPVFRRWFGIEVTEPDEFRARRETKELVCLTPAARKELNPANLNELVSAIGTRRAARARRELAALGPDERRNRLRRDWSKLLGDTTPASPARVVSSTVDQRALPGAVVERVLLEVEPDLIVPLLLLSPAAAETPTALVVAIAQTGKAGFLQHRAGEVAALLKGGAVVCLPDLRGTGETRAGASRDRTSGDTNRSVNVQLHNESLLGQRLRDLQSVLGWLRNREKTASAPLTLWGDSFAPPNDPETNFRIPHGVGGRPPHPEPLGGLLVLLGGLHLDQVARLYLCTGLSSFQSALTVPHLYLPHDTVVPGALAHGDLAGVAAGLAPRPLRIDTLVDALNRPLAPGAIRAEYQPAVDSYRRAGAERMLSIAEKSSAAEWMLGN